MRALTREEIELLSIYRDHEGTPEQTAEAESLLAASPEARNWLLQVERAERLAVRSTAGTAGRPVDLSRITGERIAAAAGSGRRLFDHRPAGVLLTGLFGVTLIAASLILSDPESIPSSAPASSRQERVASSFSLPPVADGIVRDITPFSAPLSEPAPQDEMSTRSLPVPHRAIPKEEDRQEVAPETTPEATLRESASPDPLHLSINLHHSSAKIIIGDDQWSDTLRFGSSEDQILTLSARLSRLTDSLNADVARIAADTTRTAQDRAGEILLRQMEYEARVARELEILRRMMEDGSSFEGACLEDRGTTGVS